MAAEVQVVLIPIFAILMAVPFSLFIKIVNCEFTAASSVFAFAYSSSSYSDQASKFDCASVASSMASSVAS